MSKYCYSCGAETGEEQTFCTKCGARQQAPADEQQTAPDEQSIPMEQTAKFEQCTQAKEGKKDRRKVVITAVIAAACVLVVVVVAVIALIAGSLFGTGYEAPIKNMFDGMERADYDVFVSAFTPQRQAFIEQKRKDEKMTKKEFMDSYVLEKEDLEDYYGKNVHIDYKILDKDKADKEDLEEIISDYELNYPPTEAYYLYLEVTIGGSKLRQGDNFNITVVNLHGNWYALNLPDLFD